MLRILRAFAWMRWRTLVNSLERTGSRDKVQRLAVAIEHIAPILLMIVMIPSAIALAGIAGMAGYTLVTGERSFAFQLVRYAMLLGTVLIIFGQIVVPSADRTNPIRLLLLPIEERTLYVAQTAGALADPWLALLVPLVIGVPVGLAIAGAFGSALVAVVAGALIILTLLGISALTTTLIHLLLRDRRRGELVALFLIMVLPLLSLLPSILGSSYSRRARSQSQQERPAARRSPLPPWALNAGRQAFSMTPSELYVTSVQSTTRVATASPAAPLGGLGAFVVIVHGIGLVMFRRALASPASTSRRTVAVRGIWERVLPGVSPPASAVALAFVRLVLRTPRGRSVLIGPLIFFVIFALFTARAGGLDFGSMRMRSGLGLATLAGFMSLLSINPIALNQFAVDGAGLTMALLAPLSTRQLLIGKAVGGGLIALPPALLVVLLSRVAFSGGHPALWLALLVSLFATYILASPIAAMLSTFFPRVVDMNSIGKGSNAHGVAGVVGLLAFAAAGLPCAALTFAATTLLDQAWLAPALVTIWCGVAILLAQMMFRAAERIFDKRREHLAMLL